MRARLTVTHAPCAVQPPYHWARAWDLCSLTEITSRRFAESWPPVAATVVSVRKRTRGPVSEQAHDQSIAKRTIHIADAKRPELIFHVAAEHDLMAGFIVGGDNVDTVSAKTTCGAFLFTAV
jgi:hypothetical protein